MSRRAIAAYVFGRVKLKSRKNAGIPSIGQRIPDVNSVTESQTQEMYKSSHSKQICTGIDYELSSPSRAKS